MVTHPEGRDLPLNHVFRAASPDSRWFRLDLSCDCSWNVSFEPLLTGTFRKADLPMYHFLGMLSNMSLGVAHGVDHRETLDWLRHDPLSYVISEDDSTITARIEDFTMDGRGRPGVVRSHIVALPHAIGPTNLTIKTGYTEAHVTARTQEGRDVGWWEPTPFQTSNRTGMDFTLTATFDTPVWAQLFPSFEPQYGPDAYGAKPYTGTRREPHYTITGPMREWSFERGGPMYKTEDPHHGALMPYFSGPAGTYEIRLRFPAGTADEDLIFPYMITFPFDR